MIKMILYGYDREINKLFMSRSTYRDDGEFDYRGFTLGCEKVLLLKRKIVSEISYCSRSSGTILLLSYLSLLSPRDNMT